MRALPAGPTVLDMLANAAFLVGLTLGLAGAEEDWIDAVPFVAAHNNFYRAAQAGLDAKLAWPPAPGAEPAVLAARDLVPRLLSLARQGLIAAGVNSREATRLLDVIRDRAATGQTGAAWQRMELTRLEQRLDRGDALAAMLERYLECSQGGKPVHEWSTEA
jgi:hypothetical protein